MKKLSEFKTVTEIPYNEEIEIDADTYGRNSYIQQTEMLRLIGQALPLGVDPMIIRAMDTSYDRLLIKDNRGNIPKPEPEPTTFDFSQALKELKAGKKVARAGWNGKNMWLMYVSGSGNAITSNEMGDMIMHIDELPRDMDLLPWIGMKTADNKFVPWLCSQTDMLASDWMIVEP